MSPDGQDRLGNAELQRRMSEDSGEDPGIGIPWGDWCWPPIIYDPLTGRPTPNLVTGPVGCGPGPEGGYGPAVDDRSPRCGEVDFGLPADVSRKPALGS